MALFKPTSPDTLEDRRLYTEERLVEVACDRCSAQVRVKKNSDHHVVIQWSELAVSQCEEFSEMEATPSGRDIHVSCGALRSTIDRAVAEGKVEIGAIDGY